MYMHVEVPFYSTIVFFIFITQTFVFVYDNLILKSINSLFFVYILLLSIPNLPSPQIPTSPPTLVSSTPDTPITSRDGSQLQYFWEAFPAGSGKKDRTTYLFTYMDAKKERPAISDVSRE